MSKEKDLEKAFADIKEAVAQAAAQKADTEGAASTPEQTAVKAAKKSRAGSAADAKTAPKKTAGAVSTADRPAATKKKTVSATGAAGTSAARKRAKQNLPDFSLAIEFHGRQLYAEDLKARAIEAFRKLDAELEIQTLAVYVVVEENAAYYVVNGVASREYRLAL